MGCRKRREGKRERKERDEEAMEKRRTGSTEPKRLSSYAVCRQVTLLRIGSILLSRSLFLSSTRPSSFLRAFLSSISLLLSRSPRGTRFVLALGRRCAASGLLVPLCSRSFVQYSVRERRRGGWLKAGNGWQRPGEEKRRRFSRARKRTHGTRFHRWLVGLRMVHSHDRNQPGRRRSEGEQQQRSRGSLPRVIMRNETCARERRIGRIVSE